MAPSTRCYPMDFEPGTTELRLPTKSSISFILQPVLFKGNLTLSKILPPNLNARKFSIHFIYLVFLLLAGNLKTYRDGSSQCILVSPDKSMLTVKFTLKWNKDINLYKSNTHNCSSMCQYSTFKNIYLMLQKSLNFSNILDY